MLETHNNLKCCHLLLEEALAQPQENVPAGLLYSMQQPPDNMTHCINLLNTYRCHHHWPLASGMSCLDVDLDILDYSTDVDLNGPRAVLQESLIALFKKQDTASVVAALANIENIAGTHVLSVMAKKLKHLVKNLNQFDDPESILDCLKRYDILLKDCQHPEKLYVDISFYHQQLDGGSPQWSFDPSVMEHLAKRTQLYAQRLAGLLQAQDSEAVLFKEKIWPLYLAITDGLLFGQHFELRARIEARFAKLDQLDDPMLLIAVPAQKLWAECIRITVSP